jgi:hypothetical protein
LLHAFLPARHVDHVHADAICALTNTPNAELHVREALGPDVAVVPYVRPGFTLSQQVAELSGARAVVLDKHGLVTWGESHEESYELTLELVARAERHLAERERPQAAVAPDLEAGAAESLLLELRGLLSRDGMRVLHVDRGQRALADRPDVDLVATAARATPDHVLRIGPRSLVVHDPGAAAAAVRDFEEGYGAYFARWRHRLPEGVAMLSPLPRVVLVPGLGCIAAGADERAARVNAEIAARSHLVTARVLDAFGEVAWLDEQDVFDFDYWPLELAKLAGAPPPRDFSGRVAIITGAGSPLGAAVAKRLARDGAHLVLTGAGDLERVAASLSGPVLIATGDPLEAAIAEFGGVDSVVALDLATSTNLERLGAALRRQGAFGAVVGLESQHGPTVNLAAAPSRSLRSNLVRADRAAPDEVAEAMVFLVSSRSAAIDRATIPVGGSHQP